MAERPQPHQLQVHPQRHHEQAGDVKSYLRQKGPSATQVLAVLSALPVCGTLLALAGLALTGSVIGLVVTFPLFVIFSPVLVPAAITVGLAVMAFMASGAFGLTGLSSLSWFVNCLRQVTRTMPEQLDQAKRRMQDVTGYMGQKTKEVGQEIQKKSQEGGGGGGGRT